MTTRLVIFTLLFLTTIVQLNAQTDSLYNSALNLYNQENYQDALMLFRQVCSDDSSNLNSLEKFGLCAFRLGDFAASKKQFSKLEQKDSSNLVAIKSLASIYETEKNTPKAIKYYLRLTTLIPNNPINYRKLGQQFQKASLPVDAKKYYDLAYGLNPKDSHTINGLAELYLLEKKYEQADSIILKGLILDPSNINYNLLIANSKYRQKAYDSTVYYMKVIKGKYDPRPHQSKMIGYAYLQIDSFELAINYLTRAINDDGTKEHAHYNIAVAHEKLGNMEYALHHYQQALDAGISQNVDLYHRSLARLYAKDEKYKDAIPHYQDAYKYGEDPLVLFYLARASDIYYRDKNIAIRYYNRFIKSTYDHPENKSYAKQRITYLKELEHQKNN